MSRAIIFIPLFVLCGSFFAQNDNVLIGDVQNPIVLSDMSEFTIKGEVRDGVQMIEIKIYDSNDLLVPLHTTTWQREGGEGPVNYILSESDEYTFIVDHYSSGLSSESIRLKQILENALDLYIDGSLSYKKTHVELRRPASAMIQDMDAIVKSGAAHFTEDAGFNGFSPAVQRQLDRVGGLEWGNMQFAVDGGDDQDKYLAIYYYVNKQVQDLKGLVHSEINSVAQATVLSLPNDPSESADTGNRVFDDENYMIPLDLYAETENGEVELIAEAPVLEQTPLNRKVRKRDEWLLEELNGIKRKIDLLGEQNRNAAYEERLDALEDQLIEIRELLEEKKDPIVPNTDNPIADLSELTGKNVTVQFKKYSNKISPEFQLILNEVFVELARNPDHKIIVTGYADKSGNSHDNLRLSELRAQAVKYFIQERGIEGERLLVNYFGDSKSHQKNPEERRVEIEWLVIK